MLTTLTQLLTPYQEIVERAIRESIPLIGKKSTLRDACEYALVNGGKRFRPALALWIADSINKEIKPIKAALAIEFFHTASLIADDLPCMDDDDERRQKPSLHKVFGESTALLASYALISAGYEFLVDNAEQIKKGGYFFSDRSDSLCLCAIKNVSINTGIEGAAGGQWIDLFPPTLTQEALIDVLIKKTVTLFEISFVLGWLFGGGEEEKLDLVKKCARHFGLAFQIVDDIGDMEQDKRNGRMMNWANLFGLEEARKALKMEQEQFLQTAKELKLLKLLII